LFPARYEGAGIRTQAVFSAKFPLHVWLKRERRENISTVVTW